VTGASKILEKCDGYQGFSRPYGGERLSVTSVALGKAGGERVACAGGVDDPGRRHGGHPGGPSLSSESLLVRADHLRDIVAFREARAARLVDQERPLSLHCVITTWALEVAIGTPEVRRAQLEHLARMADLPTVTIQVLRPRDGMHAAITTGPFVLLELDAANPIGYVELLDGAAYLTDRTRLATYQVAADDLKRVALNPQQSLDLIRQAMLAE
jgi:Domain of unknown function (DUF5753)